MFEAKVIKDSICNGHRLTTMQLTHPRIVHAEVMTHCAFARNASSSRAIPFTVTVKRVQENPFIPVYWGENMSGMQAAHEIADWKKPKAEALWLEARNQMIRIASVLAAKECPSCQGRGKTRDLPLLSSIDLYGTPTTREPAYTNIDCPDCNGTGEGINLHKQICNRLTETWAWITACVTGDADAWSNYFSLRCHPDAQPEIQKQAYMAQLEYFKSTPEVLPVGAWHTPYIRPTEDAEIRAWALGDLPFVDTEAGVITRKYEDALIKISTGRCARTSYLTQEGTRDFSKDIGLHDRLRYHVPLHACYDNRTEVLSTKGWVNWSEVAESDELAAFDLATETVKFETPSAVHSFPYEGDMYHVEGQAIDLMVTPNHNMVVKTGKNGGSWTPLTLLEAGKVYNKSVAYVKAGELEPTQRVPVANPFGVEPIAFSRFVGFFLGDGHAPIDTANVVTFHLHRSRKVEFLNSIGVPTRVLAGDTYTVDLPGISKWCRSNLYDDVGQKILPKAYIQAPSEQVEALLDGLRNSDGSTKRDTWVYYSTSPKLVNMIQAISTLNGVVATLTEPSVTTAGNVVYCLNFSTRKYPRVEFVRGRSFTYTNSFVPYKGNVYCATVSTGALVVRRGGKVAISGNSPFEHVCQAMGDDQRYAKYTGWKAYRHMLDREYVTDFKPNHPGLMCKGGHV